MARAANEERQAVIDASTESGGTGREHRADTPRSPESADALASRSYVPSLPDQAPIADPTRRRLMRLALDLHDGPLQGMAAAGFQLQALRSSLRRSDPEQIDAGLAELQSHLGSVERALRALVESKEVPTLDPGHFAAIVEGVIERFRRWFPVVTALEVTGNVEPATDSQRIALERVLQEALNNVAKHAQASRVTVRLVGRAEEIELEIEDDGIGFDVATVQRDEEGKGLGLAGMLTRLRLLDGDLRVESRPGGPTKITASVRRWRPPSHGSS